MGRPPAPRPRRRSRAPSSAARRRGRASAGRARAAAAVPSRRAVTTPPAGRPQPPRRPAVRVRVRVKVRVRVRANPNPNPNPSLRLRRLGEQALQLGCEAAGEALLAREQAHGAAQVRHRALRQLQEQRPAREVARLLGAREGLEHPLEHLVRVGVRARVRVRVGIGVGVGVGVGVRPSSTVSRHASHTVCSVSVASGRMADAHAACSSADCGSSCSMHQSERAACARRARPDLHHISPTSPLHLPARLRMAGPYLAYISTISPVSPLHLPYICPPACGWRARRRSSRARSA